ncbi:hypothetical protein CEW87_13595 [Parazoarcus communis]|uniref:DUF58 domain-containing protein n=2 Tax=Parazoarcus communis TaxID=41977 RepID=A0A2U8H3V1_9RHOO|nr:hypothetical protein CEW87_13595 [Parazoarcus communis]
MRVDAVSSGARRLIDRWLFRLGRPEAAPIILYQRRIYVLPTAAGYAFALALLVMLIASINYNLSLGYGLTFLLGGVAVASIVHAFRNLLQLSIRSGRTEPTFCGDTVIFRLLIDNRRPARRPALTLRAQGGSSAFDLPPGTVTEVSLALPTKTRGTFPLGRTTLETRWPLGLIRAWSVFIPDSTGLVYPAPEADPPPLPGQTAGEAHGQRSLRPGDDDFAGLRNYQTSDSPQHLAWKVLARGGALMTKQFSSLEGGDVSLEWSSLPPTLDDEARLSRLTAWLLMAERSGQRYALQLPSRYFPRGCGRAHLHQCLSALALHGQPHAGSSDV